MGLSSPLISNQGDTKKNIADSSSSLLLLLDVIYSSHQQPYRIIHTCPERESLNLLLTSDIVLFHSEHLCSLLNRHRVSSLTTPRVFIMMNDPVVGVVDSAVQQNT